MSIPRTVGATGLTFQGNKLSYDPRKGVDLGYPYKGPFQAAIAAAFSLIQERIPFDFVQEGPFATITLKGNTSLDPAGNSPSEVPVDRWDLQGNETQQSIFLHPNLLKICFSAKFTWTAPAANSGTPPAGTVASAQQVAAAIQADINLQSAGSAPMINSGQPSTLNVTDAPTKALMLAMEEYAFFTGSTYDVISPVLRHTYTISDNYAGSEFNFSNQEKIYTTENLLAECAEFPYPLPAPYVQAVKSVPIPSVSGTSYTVGWKKTPPDANTVARCKNEVVTEYKFGVWDTAFAFSLAANA